MPFEVFNIFFRCSQIHKAHSKLEDAAACFTQLTQCYGEDLPVHPISQKYVYMIAAIDRKGKQRDISKQEMSKAAALHLDPKSLATEIPGITTFSHLAKLYFEASRMIPLSHINLDKIFDYQDQSQHFWNTDAGKGQALAYVQQAAFTLELSLKAYLEVLGKFASPNKKDIDKLHIHNLFDLFKLLTENEKNQLAKWWEHSDAKHLHVKGSLQEFLKSRNNIYKNWRYITDQKSVNLSEEFPMLLSVSDFLLDASDRVFRNRTPIKLKVNTKIYPNTVESSKESLSTSITSLVEGKVRGVSIPDGFDPFSLVELVIDSDQHKYPITATFNRRYVENYYGLEGKKVRLVGKITKNQPQLLQEANHLELDREPKYTSERLTLRGHIYDIRKFYPKFGGTGKVDLVLYDKTFFTEVECFFVSGEEREKLNEVKPGDEILISGTVMLLNGLPVVLVGPDCIERVIEDPGV